MAYAKMNKNKEAEEAYKNALRLDPDNADYQNNLSVTQQRIQEGIAFLQLFILTFAFCAHCCLWKVWIVVGKNSKNLQKSMN